MTDEDFPKLLTPREVAARFRVDAKTVTRWADAKKIARVRTPGGHSRFREDEIMALLRGEAPQAEDSGEAAQSG